MKPPGWLARLPRLLTKNLTPLALLLLQVQPSLAQPGRSLSFVQVSQDGFGDRENSYSWSMAWFKGKVYVGTNRNFVCVERATVDFYFPGLHFYSPNPEPDIVCALTPQDLDLRAEIWRYTPETGMWDRVFQSPEVTNPRHPDQLIALDIGFRDMAVFTEPDGTEALYVGGVTAGEYTPGLPPARILRSTDGESFEPIPQDPANFLGAVNVVGFRAMTVYKNRLYVTATTGLVGDGVILEAANPAGSNDNFRRVSPEGMRVFELAVFNGFLYAGVGDLERGYSVWKTDATGAPPYRFTPVVTDGAGRGTVMLTVVSMHPFKRRLYVGSNSWFPRSSSELIRVNPDDTWEVVVGNPRQTPEGLKLPISGLPDGFGNVFNVHLWRMQEHHGALYVGTNDASWGLRALPMLGPLFQYEFGFDLFTTVNGRNWFRVTRDGFGDKFNFGLRTFASTPHGLFVGTVNYVTGTEVWLVGTGRSVPGGRERRPSRSGSGRR